MNNNSVCYLNGKFLPLANASVPVLDRGFIFGDGVYEVIPVFSGHTFRLTEHLQRLANSLQAVHIKNPHSLQGWSDLIHQLISKNEAGHQSIYLQVTRGVAPRDHSFPDEIKPTVFIMSNSLPDTSLVRPVSAIVLEDPRWNSCHIKATSLLPNVLLRQQARVMGAYEAILVRAGKLTEGAASNVFVVSDGVIRTPPKSQELLPGITRDLVVELLHEHQIPCQEVKITESELRDADEIWLTSSTKEIVPVTQLDDQPVGSGEPGAMWFRIVAIYQAFKDTFTGADAVA